MPPVPPWRKAAVFLAHALVGWALCGAIIAIGRSLTTMENTLIIHALGVPVIFTAVSYSYFRFFHYSSPLHTAAWFTWFAIGMDFFIIATFVEKSYAMFSSALGTWIPFLLIWLSTYLTGTALAAFARRPAAGKAA